MHPTMEDVARRAGVSKSTVSLALNNKSGVSPELRDAVLQAAHELGYRLPEHRPLRRSPDKRSITIVHCEGQVPDASPEPASLYLEYLDGIQTFFGEREVNLTFIASYREGADKEHLGFHLLSDEKLPCDGFILMGLGARQHSPLIHQLLKENMPVVVISRHWPHLPISSVSQDHHQQASIAIDHLVQLGHRNIAFLARDVDRYYDWFEWRLSCYRDAMVHLNGEMDEDLLALGADGAEAAKSLMARRPDVSAIFGVNDGRAVEAMRGLRELELDVPQDVSVIGVDDTTKPPEGYPALTTIAYPHFELGYLAAELLLKQIENDTLLYANILVRSNLVERASCARPRS
jgi:LacI family transcriptional regulator